MKEKLVECIPNFSEGQRLEVVEAIEAAIASVPRVRVLDRNLDADHNRSVITFAGPPQAVLEAAFASIAKAAELIDLEQHRGEHPRLGAADVVPFVPLSGVTMEECVELAQRLGKRVGEELGIPVYLYERAATRPDRINLEDIRRGEYEALKLSLGVDPARQPDYGPTTLGKAGATVIGARPPLIAFNIYLDTDHLETAKQIARSVRHSSGGLRYVKALGMLVEGRAQVSTNLTDFTKTPLARVVEMIRREAARYGVSIHHSELVGLLPQAALIDAARWYMQLDGFESGQVLESQLHAGQQVQETFLEQLAAGTPTPGGGSAAAYAGGMAAGLVAMVARLTIGKKKYLEVDERMHEIAEEADALRHALETAVLEDCKAFEDVMSAFRLKKETPEQKAERSQAIEAATHQAALVPLGVAQKVGKVMELAAEAAQTGNVNAITDAGSAAALARASLRAAGLNVRINAQSVRDQKAAGAWLEELEGIEATFAKAEKRVAKALKARADLTA